MKKDSGKKESDKKNVRETEDLKKAESSLVKDEKRDTVRTGQKVSIEAKKTGKKAETAGNEMKAGLQEMKKDIQQIHKKADKKSRK